MISSPRNLIVPRVNALHLNVVEAVQREQAAEERFSVSAYEAGKTLKLLYHPVLEAQVWVDEIGGVAVSDAQALAQTMPDRVELEWEDRVLTHCWVRWERRQQLALAGPGNSGNVACHSDTPLLQHLESQSSRKAQRRGEAAAESFPDHDRPGRLCHGDAED